MKTCPNCDENLGDSVKVCIKCRYDFVRKRVITNEELAEKRDRQIKQQEKLIEEAKAKEEHKNIAVFRQTYCLLICLKKSRTAAAVAAAP